MVKKIYCILLVVLTIGLSACAKNFKYEYDKMIKEVEKIEIVFVNQFYPEKDIELLKDLDETEMKECLFELSKFNFKELYGAPSNIKHYCIKIYYINGDYEFVSNKTAQKLNSSNSFVYQKNINFDDIENFISNYVDILEK